MKNFDSQSLILNRLNSLLNLQQITTDYIEYQQITPKIFIQNNFQKEMTVICGLCEINALPIFEMFLDEINKVLKPLGFKEFAFQVSVYLFISKKICKYAKTDEIANESICNKIVNQSLIILGVETKEINAYIKYIQKYFEDFLGYLGLHSKVIFKVISNCLVLAASSKKFSLYLTTLMYLNSNITLFKHTYDILMQLNFQKLPKNNKRALCELTATIIIHSIKKNPEEFFNYLRNNSLFPGINLLEDKFKQLGGKGLLTRLIMKVLSTSVKDVDLENQLEQFNEVKNNINLPIAVCIEKEIKSFNAITYGFRLLSVSHNHPYVNEIMKPYYAQFLIWFVQAKQFIIVNFNNNFLKNLLIDFPICVMYYNTTDFVEKVLPIVIQNDVFLAKLIRTICKQVSHFPDRLGYLLEYIKTPTINLLEKAQNDSKYLSYFYRLLTAFKYCPSFFFDFIWNGSNSFLIKFLTMIKNFNLLQIKEAFYAMFNNDYINKIECTLDFWNKMKSVICFLFEFIKDKKIYESSQFITSMINVAFYASQFFLCLFQSYKERSIEKNSILIIEDIISYFEATSLLLFSSSVNKIIIGKSMLQNLIEVVTIIPEAIPFPIETYQGLISEINKNNSFSFGNNCIRSFLRVSLIQTYGTELAFNTLYRYFLEISNDMKMNPDNYLEQEFIGIALMLFSLKSDKSNELFNIIKELVKNNDNKSNTLIPMIPNTIHVNHIIPFIENINNWIKEIQSNKNSPETLIIFKNILIFLNVLISQDKWRLKKVNIETISEIFCNILQFCDLINDETLRNGFSNCINSLKNPLTASELSLPPNTRHKIAKSLIDWLSTMKSQAQTLQAISYMLDNLSLLDCIDKSNPKLSEEQAKELFMFYFVAIKSRLDIVKEENSKPFITLLASLFKKNLNICMEQILAMGFNENNNVRSVFMSALSLVLSPENILVENQNDNISLIDFLLDWDLSLITFISGLIPYSRADVFSDAILRAAISKNREMELISQMIDLELKNVNESTKNSLFRGNSMSSQTVSCYPKIIAQEWMRNLLEPIFDEVVNDVVDKKLSFTVDPRKLSENDNLQRNQENLREILIKTIDRITNGLETIPIGIVEEMKLLYSKIFEKFGDFAMLILYGFLFLRFLFPTFSMPDKIQYKKEIPTHSRETLSLISNILMNSVLVCDISEDKAYLRPFLDVSRKANKDFNDMFNKILENNFEVPNPEIEIDIEKITNNIHTELWAIQRQLNNVSDDSSMAEPIAKLIHLIHSMGTPKVIIRSKMLNRPIDYQNIKVETIKKFKFTDEQLQQVSGFMVKEDHNAIDGSAIIYLYFDKLSSVTDSSIVGYLIVKELTENKAEQISFVLFLRNFDETKIPSPQLIKSIIQMKITTKVVNYYLFEPNYAFANFVSRNQSLFANSHKFIFIKDMLELTSKLGKPNKNFAETSLESLTTPFSVHYASVNGQKCNVQIHPYSIQFHGNLEKFKNFEFTPITVVLLRHIKQITFPKTSKNDQKISFTVSTKDQDSYVITQQITSSTALFDAVYNLTQRIKTIDNLKGNVKVDTTTLKWLILNIAFINLVNPYVSNSVHKAALDLVYLVYQSFPFQHKVSPIKIDDEIINENLIPYVLDLSKDLADNNSENYFEFITEFFNIYTYIENNIKQFSFIFLKPWLKHWVNDFDSHPELLNKLIEIHEQDHLILTNVWTIFSKHPKQMKVLLETILKNDKFISTSDIILSLQTKNQKILSELLVNTYLPLYKSNVTLILNSLILSDSFYYDDNILADLIFTLTQFIFICTGNEFIKLTNLFENVLHLIIHESNKSPKTFIQFHSLDKLNDNEKIFQIKSFALSLHEVLSINIEKLLYRKYINYISNEDYTHNIYIISCLIMAAAFSESNEKNYLDVIQRIIRKTKNNVILSAISISLSIVKIDSKLISKYFLLGIVLCFYLKNSFPLYLISSTFSNINDIPIETLSYIEGLIELPIKKNHVFTVLILTSVFAKTIDEVNLTMKKTNNYVSKISLLINSPKESLEVPYDFNFGKHATDFAFCLFLLLMLSPKSSLLNYLTLWIENSPKIFEKLDFLHNKFGLKMIITINNTYLNSLLFNLQKSSNRNKLTYSILLNTINQTLNDYNPITNEILDKIISMLFDEQYKNK